MRVGSSPSSWFQNLMTGTERGVVLELEGKTHGPRPSSSVSKGDGTGMGSGGGASGSGTEGSGSWAPAVALKNRALGCRRQERRGWPKKIRGHWEKHRLPSFIHGGKLPENTKAKKNCPATKATMLRSWRSDQLLKRHNVVTFSVWFGHQQRRGWAEDTVAGGDGGLRDCEQRSVTRCFFPQDQPPSTCSYIAQGMGDLGRLKDFPRVRKTAAGSPFSSNSYQANNYNNCFGTFQDSSISGGKKLNTLMTVIANK